SPPRVWPCACRAHRAACGVGSAGGEKLRGRQPCAGDVSAAAVGGCGPAAGAVSLYVRSPGESWMELRQLRTLRKKDATGLRSLRICYDVSRNCAGIFSRAANHISALL